MPRFANTTDKKYNYEKISAKVLWMGHNWVVELILRVILAPKANMGYVLGGETVPGGVEMPIKGLIAHILLKKCEKKSFWCLLLYKCVYLQFQKVYIPCGMAWPPAIAPTCPRNCIWAPLWLSFLPSGGYVIQENKGSCSCLAGQPHGQSR